MAIQNGPKYPYKICYVEDSPTVSEPIDFGMRALLGADVTLFRTTTLAQENMREHGYNQWGVYVLDNRTGHGNISGLNLGLEIKAQNPDAVVVALNSSDMKEMTDYGLGKLSEQGIEFWYKLSESFMMIAWLADCAKENRMIPRAEWLTNMGESPRYIGAYDGDAESDRRTDRQLRMMCMRGVRSPEIDPNLMGVLMREDTKSFLQSLDPSRSGERR